MRSGFLRETESTDEQSHNLRSPRYLSGCPIPLDLGIIGVPLWLPVQVLN